MRLKTRSLAEFDSYQFGLLDASNAKRLLAAWVNTIPSDLLGFSVPTADRKTLLGSLRMRYTSDVVEYQLVDGEIDELTLAALGDHLRAFACGWTSGFLRRDEQMLESL